MLVEAFKDEIKMFCSNQIKHLMCVKQVYICLHTKWQQKCFCFLFLFKFFIYLQVPLQFLLNLTELISHKTTQLVVKANIWHGCWQNKKK